MCGIVVRTGSKATLEKTVVIGSLQFGVAVSDLSELVIQSSTLYRNQIASICCYNHANAHIESSFLIGPTVTGVDIFTGGRVDCLNSSIIGMSGKAIWSHLGGSGAFIGLSVSQKRVQVKPSDHQTIRHYSGTLGSQPICPIEHLIKNESERSMSIEMNGVTHEWNVMREPFQPGENAAPPHCKVCGKISSDCIFAPCAHSIFCRTCWEQIAEKPTVCELCLIPIESVCHPINCAIDEAGLCSICYNYQCDSIMVPCGHLICHGCATQWLLSNIYCPFCRTPDPQVRWRVSYE
jgi:hypothetical protein